MEVGVGEGTMVTFISQEGAGVLVCVGVLVGVLDGLKDKVGVIVGVKVFVGVMVFVDVFVGVGVEVGVGLGTIVTFISQEGAGVLVCVGVIV